MSLKMACIVEGHGDREAVPVLIRRLASKQDPAMIIHIPPPIRIPKNKLLKPGELERAVDLAGRRIAGSGAVLILLDSDEDCPAQLGPALLQRAFSSRQDVPSAVVIAKREFESWLLAAAESLRGHRGLASDLTSPSDAEAIAGAKEWLTAHMAGGRRYVETLDQPALAARFDLDLARRADSFDKCYREINRLLVRLNKA
jgi:hypothetical protein